MGELALDGSVRPVRGALSMAMEARDRGVTKLIVPAANAQEAAVVREAEVYGVTSLAEAVGFVSGPVVVDPVAPGMDEIEARLNRYDVDFADVRGQEFAKRALTVAAAGGHNVDLWSWSLPFSLPSSSTLVTECANRLVGQGESLIPACPTQKRPARP